MLIIHTVLVRVQPRMSGALSGSANETRWRRWWPNLWQASKLLFSKSLLHVFMLLFLSFIFWCNAIRYDASCTCVCSFRFQLKFYTFQNSHIYIFDLCLLIAICNRFVFDLHRIFKLIWIFHNWISVSGISSQWATDSWAKLRYDCTVSEILLQFMHTNKCSVRPYVWIAVFLWCSSID